MSVIVVFIKYHIFIKIRRKNMTLLKFLSQLIDEIIIEKAQIIDDEYYSEYYKAYLEE